MEQMTQSDTALAAELNDLLKLDHDAVQAYTLAIRLLENEEYKRQLEVFRAVRDRMVGRVRQFELAARPRGIPTRVTS